MEPVKLEKEKPYIISLSQTNNNIRKKPKVNVEEGKTGEEDKPEVVNKEPKETFSHDEEGEEDQNAPEKNVCIHAITLNIRKLAADTGQRVQKVRTVNIGILKRWY